MSKLISAFLIALGISLSGFFISQGFVESRKPSRYVEVKGLAEKVVKSDQAILTINFRLVNNDLSALYQSLSATQKKIRQFLQDEGFTDKEISTNPINVVDNQSNNYNQNTNVPRYTADSGMTVATNHVDLVRASVQKTGNLVEQDIVVTSANAQYRFISLNNIKPAMLTKATKNAREAAESFAKNAQLSVGTIRRAIQGLFSIHDEGQNYDSGGAVYKKVRVVTTVEYQLNS